MPQPPGHAGTHTGRIERIEHAQDLGRVHDPLHSESLPTPSDVHGV